MFFRRRCTTCNSYKEAVELLQNRYGNTHQVIAAHMNTVVKMSSVDNEDLSELRKFFDDVTSHVRSLVNLEVRKPNCVILENLPNELRLIIPRNNNENDWKFTKILDLINVEIEAPEACVAPSHAAAEGKNDVGFSSPSHTPYTGSSLVPGSSSVHGKYRKFKKGGGKGHSLESSGRKYVFCDGDHWSNICQIVLDIQARKDLLKKGNRCFICLKADLSSRNGQKTKLCFYCNKLHNSAVCSEKTSAENRRVFTNYASNILSVLLQTADLVIENPLKNHV